jgi:hypothetical protein
MILAPAWVIPRAGWLSKPNLYLTSHEEGVMSVVEQHVKIFACDGCEEESEQEPSIAQIAGWVRIAERSDAATRLWDFCSWDCASGFIASGAPEEGGIVVEDAPARRGRR